MNNNSFYSNMQCYNEKGDRFAVFAIQIDKDYLEIFLLKCGRKDQFSKQIAKNVYFKWLEFRDLRVINSMGFKPTIFKEKIQPDDSAIYTFNQFCKTNFFFKSEKIVKYKEQYLYNLAGIEINLPKTRQKFNKIDGN